jgi:acyl carrier protein
VEDKLRQIVNTVRENKGLSLITEIKKGDDLRTDFGFDSLDLAELTVRIEKEFNIDVFATGLVLTVNDILNKLRQE